MIITKTKKINMATSKKVENKVKGYFFMSINNDVINVDMAGDDTSLAAAFGMLLTSKAKSNADIKRILAASLEFAIQHLESKKKKPIAKAVKKK
jgi:hypothetical protein